MEGRIAVRMIAEPNKVIRMEFYKDLIKIPGFSGEYNWVKLKLIDTSA